MTDQSIESGVPHAFPWPSKDYQSECHEQKLCHGRSHCPFLAGLFEKARRPFQREASHLHSDFTCCVRCFFLYQLRTDNIFACPASGYTSDRYLSNCGTSYGDYEHGAFWFDLEPAAEMSAASADVLFLGDSRMLLAFSTAATTKWFSSASASFYLLGFYAFRKLHI